MSCASLQCQNEKIQARKLLDKQKRSALNSVAFESIFERQFREYVGEVRRHKRITLAVMESKFQQHCLNNEEDPDVTESMQAQEVEQYLALKSRVLSLFNDILRTCSNVANSTSASLPLGEIGPEEDLMPVDFDADQDNEQCMFCLNKELIAEREMANHVNYLKEVKTQRSASLTQNDGRSSSTQFELPTVSSDMFQTNIIEDAVKSLQSSSTSSALGLDTTSVSSAFSQNPFASFPPNSDAATAALLSFPMIAETLAASLLEMGLVQQQQQQQQQQLDARNPYNDLSMMFPFYSMPGFSELPKNLSKNMVTQFFDAALGAQNGNSQSSVSASETISSSIQEEKMEVNETESVAVNESSATAESAMNSEANRNDSEDEKLTGTSSTIEDASNAIKRTYSSTELHQALRDVCDGKMGTRRASLTYGVPRSTIRNHLNKIKNYGKDVAFRMIDSETGCSDSIGDLLTLRGKQMISELRYVEQDVKPAPKGSDPVTAFPLVDKNQNLSDRFVKHSLAGHLEDYLARQSLQSELIGQQPNSNSDLSALPLLPERVENVYLSESDVQYYNNLKCALTAVHSYGMSVSKASAIFNIHTSNIRDALTMFLLAS